MSASSFPYLEGRAGQLGIQISLSGEAVAPSVSSKDLGFDMQRV